MGLPYLLVGGDGFHGGELSAYLYQRQRQLAQYVQLGHGTGGRQIELLPVLRGEFLRPCVDAGHIFQAQVCLDLLQEVHPLAQTVQQREAGVRRQDRQHHAGKACAGAYVDDALAGQIQLRRQRRAVQQVQGGNVPGRGDGREVHHLVFSSSSSA